MTVYHLIIERYLSKPTRNLYLAIRGSNETARLVLRGTHDDGTT